jgi:hypothetical protein
MGILDIAPKPTKGTKSMNTRDALRLIGADEAVRLFEQLVAVINELDTPVNKYNRDRMRFARIVSLPKFLDEATEFLRKLNEIKAGN